MHMLVLAPVPKAHRVKTLATSILQLWFLIDCFDKSLNAPCMLRIALDRLFHKSFIKINVCKFKNDGACSLWTSILMEKFDNLFVNQIGLNKRPIHSGICNRGELLVHHFVSRRKQSPAGLASSWPTLSTFAFCKLFGQAFMARILNRTVSPFKM